MSTMGMSQGLNDLSTDQPKDMTDSSESLTGAKTKSSSTEAKDDSLNEAAAFEVPAQLDCDSIFASYASAEEQESAANPAANVAQPVTYVTQSKFFTPLFNAAIFDGPIRIYFAQHQESQAMKLYFNLQERYGHLRKQARDVFRERGANIFVMLYPDAATFEKSFAVDFDDLRGDMNEDQALLGQGIGAESGSHASVAANLQTTASDRMGSDYVLGVRGPIEDETFELICKKMEAIVRHA